MRNTTLLVLVLASLVSGAANAYADQCAWNDTAVAARAAAIVKKGATVLEFCEPCGDAAPAKPYVVQSVSIDQSRGELIVNGQDQDLAYLYVQTGPKTFKNVGIAASCGASDVSATIEDGKPSGRTKRTPHGPNHGPTRPAPPPPPRATSIAELAGEWQLRVETRFSTCPAIKLGSSTATWTVQVTSSGQISAKSDDGTELLGTQDMASSRLVRAQLSSKQRSAVGLNLSLAWKDSFFGHLVRAEPTKNPAEPVCVVHQEVSGRRRR